MYISLSCKIISGLLLIIILYLICKQSHKESFISLQDLNLYKNSRSTYNKCRRNFRLGFKNYSNIIKRKTKNASATTKRKRKR